MMIKYKSYGEEAMKGTAKAIFVKRYCSRMMQSLDIGGGLGRVKQPAGSIDGTGTTRIANFVDVGFNPTMGCYGTNPKVLN